MHAANYYDYPVRIVNIYNDINFDEVDVLGISGGAATPPFFPAEYLSFETSE